MLPSFRLIVAAFLCGFVVVFAGLRLAATLHHVHVSMPVMAAHAAPATQRVAATIVYDLRFIGSGTTIAPVPVSLTPNATDPLAPEPPHAIAPSETATPPISAIDPDVVTRATPEDPPPEPEAQPDPPLAEPSVNGAVEAESAPGAATEPPTQPTAPANKPKPEPETEPAAAAAAPAPSAPANAARVPATDGSAPPAVAVPAQKPRAQAPRAASKPVRKKRARPAQQATSDPFAFPFNN